MSILLDIDQNSIYSLSYNITNISIIQDYESMYIILF